MLTVESVSCANSFSCQREMTKKVTFIESDSVWISYVTSSIRPDSSKNGFQCSLIKKRAVKGRLLGQKKEALNRDCGDEPHSPRSSAWPLCPISWLSEWKSDSSTSLGRVIRGNSLIWSSLYRLSFLQHERELSGTHEADLSITVGKPHSRWSWWLIWIRKWISRCESKSSSTFQEGQEGGKAEIEEGA